jgi:DNA-binding GntR family transcriptional regulator
MALKMKLNEKAYTTIKNKIFNFELKPKEIFSETELSKRLRMSRTPIREALNKLENDGLVKRLPNKGYCVVDISASEIEELYELREDLAVMALRAAARKAQQKDWLRLEETVLNQVIPDEEFAEKEFDRFSKETQGFDQEIARLSEKPVLKQLINIVGDKVNRFQWMHIFFKDRARQSRDEHLEIARCLREGKIEDAIAATRKHIRSSRDNILNLLNRKKDILYID